MSLMRMHINVNKCGLPRENPYSSIFAVFEETRICGLLEYPASFSSCNIYDWYTTGLQCSVYLCDRVSLLIEEFGVTVVKTRPRKMSHCSIGRLV